MGGKKLNDQWMNELINYGMIMYLTASVQVYTHPSPSGRKSDYLFLTHPLHLVILKLLHYFDQLAFL